MQVSALQLPPLENVSLTTDQSDKPQFISMTARNANCAMPSFFHSARNNNRASPNMSQRMQMGPLPK